MLKKEVEPKLILQFNMDALQKPNREE